MRIVRSASVILVTLGLCPSAVADDVDGPNEIRAMVSRALEIRASEREAAERQRVEDRRVAREQELASRRAREVRRLTAEVLAEADGRASKMRDGAALEGGFSLATGADATTESRDRDHERFRYGDVLFGAFQDETPEIPAGDAPMSEAELSRQLSNPVGDLWLLFFQHDITIRDVEGSGDNQITHNFKFQPVTPIALTDEWRLISRPVLQFNAFDIPQADGSFDTDVGLGDTVWLQLFSNSDPSEKWMTGFGPTWIFPTATEDTLGADNWSVGPSALAVYLGGPGEFIAGGLVQHWWDFAGSGDQTNLTDFQYILRYRATDTVNIGMAPNIQYDWTNDDWSIPVGGGFDITTKIGNLPIRFGMEAYYYVDEFDGFDNQWGLRFFIVPVVPAPKWASQPLFGR